MFLYTEKDTESGYDIQNINLYYKIHQQHQNTCRQKQNRRLSNKKQKKKDRTFQIFILLFI